MTVVGELGVNLLTVVTEPGPEPGTCGVVLRAGTINAAPLVAALVAAGFPATGPGRLRPGRAVSGARAVVADERLAAYDFGLDHPSRPAGWTPAWPLRRPRCWRTATCCSSARPATPTWS